MRALVFVFAMLAAGCTQPAPPPPPGTVQENVARLLTPETRTILTGANAMTLAHQCSRPSPGPVSAQWTPTAADIASLEPTLASVIAAHLQAAGSQASPGDYYRQYAGFVIHGRRVIYINGVASSAIESAPNPDHPFDWRTQAVSICDGGSITFGVSYDVETRFFTEFAFNGAVG